MVKFPQILLRYHVHKLLAYYYAHTAACMDRPKTDHLQQLITSTGVKTAIYCDIMLHSFQYNVRDFVELRQATNRLNVN